MDLLSLMKERYSCRSFSDRRVEEEKLAAILEAGRLAPTACNYQPQKVYVLTGAEQLSKWQKCTKCHFNEQLVLLVCTDKEQAWKRPYDGQDSAFVDGSIVLTQMMLEAHSLGIGSTWIMFFRPEVVRAEFALPENIVPVGVLAMGYPSEEAAPAPQHTARKTLEETVIRL